MPATRNRRLIGGAIALVLAVLLGWGVYQAFQPTDDPLQGQLEAQEINVSSKVPGRIGQIHVSLGQTVRRGDLLYELDSPEVRAKAAQAAAASDAARATSEKVQAGARPEEIVAARANWERALAGADLAALTYRRIEAMYAEGVVARQKRDDAQGQARSAEELATAAKAQSDLARQGARPEDKEAAAAQARQVAAVVAEAGVALDETRVHAPAQGEVTRIAIQAGELAPQGFPVMTLVDLSDTWAVLAVREDRFAPFAIGTLHQASIPALERKAQFKVSSVSALPAFATWRAAHPGGTDLRTFEVRLRPTSAVPGMRPGMTVVFDR